MRMETSVTQFVGKNGQTIECPTIVEKILMADLKQVLILFKTDLDVALVYVVFLLENLMRPFTYTVIAASCIKLTLLVSSQLFILLALSLLPDSF